MIPDPDVRQRVAADLLRAASRFLRPEQPATMQLLRMAEQLSALDRPPSGRKHLPGRQPVRSPIDAVIAAIERAAGGRDRDVVAMLELAVEQLRGDLHSNSGLSSRSARRP